MIRTGGSSRWDDGAVEASLGDDVDLNGWVAARVVDGTSVDLGNGHVCGICSGSVGWSVVIVGEDDGLVQCPGGLVVYISCPAGMSGRSCWWGKMEGQA